MDERQLDSIVNAATKQIMQRLGEGEKGGEKRILVLGKDADCPIRACLSRDFEAETGPDLARAEEFDFVVLPTWYLDRLRGGTPPQAASGAVALSGDTLDFSGQALLHERELRDKCMAAVKAVRVGKKTIITALAADYIRKRGLEVRREA